MGGRHVLPGALKRKLRALLREDVTRPTPAKAGAAAQTSSARGRTRRMSTAIGFSVGCPK